MDFSEMVDLIRPAVRGAGGVWADLGAGAGNFTRALIALIGPESTVYAVDQQRYDDAIAPNVTRRQADFTRPLDLPPLDGILMANALHFVPSQAQAEVLARICRCLQPGGQFVLVEYDLSAPLSFVPSPIPFRRFAALAERAGLSAPILANMRRSPRTGISMYAAGASRLAESV